MKQFKLLILISSLLVISSCSNQQQKENSSVIIELDYSADNRTIETINWEEGLTALEALQHAAQVETHPVGKHVFVSSINSKKGIRGETAWYYKINGQSASKLAINNEVNSGDTITWIYKTDVCSKTVDK